MLPRSLLALALLVQTPAIPKTLVNQTVLEAVPLVACGIGAGSAFRIGPGLMLSVKHVTNLKGCTIDGEPEHIFYTSPKNDFTELSDNREAHWLKVDCGGFVAGRKYVALGHARALDSIAVVPLVATGDSDGGMAILVGVFTVQPGMSGGPIIDAETHKVVGTINAANWEEGTTFSVELKGSPICGGDIA